MAQAGEARRARPGETNGDGASRPGTEPTSLRPPGPESACLEPFFVSTLVVAIAEIGDKTQLLAIVLACRFKKPWPIIAGIFVATLANHGLAALAGYWLSSLLDSMWFKAAVALGFLAMAAWALIPDKADDEAAERTSRFGVFGVTLISFFLVEIGDKTEIATAALAARFHTILLVAAGTTLGMMLANVPAVLLGEKATRFIPLRYMRWTTAVILVVLGVMGLAQAFGWMR
jgi:putative Ca2+/H+ antiporter (TMEM165/GDT1 family)